MEICAEITGSEEACLLTQSIEIGAGITGSEEACLPPKISLVFDGIIAVLISKLPLSKLLLFCFKI